jgi:hypothetical protein
VRETGVAALPHASLTFQVRVCERVQPVLLTVLSEGVGVTGPQSSVAVAVPRAALMSDAEGLQPRVEVVPVAVITGAMWSSVQVTVRETGVAALPHASLTFQVRVCERAQPVLLTVPSEGVGVTGPQLSVAVAVPRAALMSDAEGLQPRVNVVPVAVITGFSVSTKEPVVWHGSVSVIVAVSSKLTHLVAFTVAHSPSELTLSI